MFHRKRVRERISESCHVRKDKQAIIHGSDPAWMMPAYHQILFDGNLVTLVMRGFKVLGVSTPTYAGGVTGVEVQKDDSEKYGVISDFDYDIEGSSVKLHGYDGKCKILEILPSYNIDGTDYATDLSDFQIGIGSSHVESVIFQEGITEIYDAVFNSCDVQKVFFPKSMINVTDKALSYLNPKEDGDLIQIYYAGTQDDWGNIFTEYKRTKVEDAEFGEELGTSIADKINSMLGGDYDSSEFEYYFSASPDDLKTE